MLDFNIWYAGMIIDNVRADTLTKARNLAKRKFSRPVVVTSLDATEEENAAAKAESARLVN